MYTPLYYYSSLLIGLLDTAIVLLQSILSNVAREILSECKSDHVTPLLKTLQWLQFHSKEKPKFSPWPTSHTWSAQPHYLSDLQTFTKPSGKFPPQSELPTGSSLCLKCPLSQNTWHNPSFLQYHLHTLRPSSRLPTSLSLLYLFRTFFLFVFYPTYHINYLFAMSVDYSLCLALTTPRI